MRTTVAILMLGWAVSVATARAGVILHETFTRTDGAAVRGTAASPVAGPNNWAGSPGFTASNNTLQSATTGSGHVLTLDFGVSYFSLNPGLYTLTADVFFDEAASDIDPVPTKSWQIGFNNATNASAGANRSLLSTDGFGGAPALVLRADGMAQVKAVNSAAPIFSSAAGTYEAGSVYSLRLELDTRPTLWTVAAFIDDIALDLNGVNPGTTYTYAENPTIRYLAIGSNITATDNGNFANYLDDLQLSVIPIPEPATFALTGLAALALVVFRRR